MLSPTMLVESPVIEQLLAVLANPETIRRQLEEFRALATDLEKARAAAVAEQETARNLEATLAKQQEELRAASLNFEELRKKARSIHEEMLQRIQDNDTKLLQMTEKARKESESRIAAAKAREDNADENVAAAQDRLNSIREAIELAQGRLDSVSAKLRELAQRIVA